MGDEPKILLVDDDPDIRRMFVDLFSPAKGTALLEQGDRLFGTEPGAPGPADALTCRVVTASSGRQGIRRVEDIMVGGDFFSIAFIDMHMPGMDGAETSRQIHAIDSNIHIVIVTAYSEYRCEDIARKSGLADFLFLRKPVDPEVIRQHARYLLKSHGMPKGRPPLRRRDTGIPETRSKSVPAFDAHPSGAGRPKPPPENTDGEFGVKASPSVEVCPFCPHGIGVRVQRKQWMRMIPFVARFRCTRCGRHFLSLVKKTP